jgi:ammonium transporter Rh
MFVHVFGAYFGLAVSFVLYRGTAYCAERQSSKDEASNDSIGETLSTAVGITHKLILQWISHVKYSEDNNRHYVSVAFVA